MKKTSTICKYIENLAQKEILSPLNMNLKSTNLKKILHFSLLLAVVALICHIGFCSGSPEQTTTMKLGGLRETAPNSLEIEGFGRFAVEEHNKKQNTLLEFTRIVKAKQQVVSGMMYHLTLEANDGGKNKIYEAKVWVKPWMNFKQLEEFKEVHDNPTTSSTLGH